MDVRMPVLDGIEATRGITRGGQLARIVIQTTYEVDERVKPVAPRLGQVDQLGEHLRLWPSGRPGPGSCWLLGRAGGQFGVC